MNKIVYFQSVLKKGSLHIQLLYMSIQVQSISNYYKNLGLLMNKKGIENRRNAF